MKFEVFDKIRVKDGTRDPDIDGYFIGGMTGIVDGFTDKGNVTIIVDESWKYPEWVQDIFNKKGMVSDVITLSPEELEHMNLLTPQPPPKQQGQVVYDGLKDLLVNNDFRVSDELKALCLERYHQGLEKYGQPLMSDDGRDTTSDVIQEMIDTLFYLAKGIMQGKDWGYDFYDLVGMIDNFVVLYTGENNES